MAGRTRIIRFVVKPIVFLACLGPAVYLTWAALTGHLSANPLSDVTNETGVWTLRFIAITLTVTPLRRVTGWNDVIRFRRMTGPLRVLLLHAPLHHLRRPRSLRRPRGVSRRHRVVDDAAESAESIGGDIYQRPFITIGFTALVLMVPLAITSTAGMIRGSAAAVGTSCTGSFT